jgi:Pro-kumamolisin, activation domain
MPPRAMPGSALSHHYLSPAAYTARFGASQAASAQVESWLRGEGFTKQQSPNWQEGATDVVPRPTQQRRAPSRQAPQGTVSEFSSSH